MTTLRKSEGTILAEVVAPLIWPVRHDATFAHIALVNAEIMFQYKPGNRIAVTLKHRNGAEVSTTSCPIAFDTGGDKERNLFRLAVSWDQADLTIAAGGSIIGGKDSVAEKTIELKTKSELKKLTFGKEDQPIDLSIGIVGPVPAELAEANSELERAARHVHRLHLSNNLVEISDIWKSYLDSVVKVRNKIIAGTRALVADEHTAKSWTGQFDKKIGDSELWSYLLHARNADTHGMKAILADTKGFIGLSAGTGITHLRDLKLTRDGIEITYTGDPPDVEVVPGRVSPLPVEDRGVTYSPPSGGAGLFHLAQGGLAFLKLWLIETVRKFG